MKLPVDFLECAEPGFIPMEDPLVAELRQQLALARKAQPTWAARPVRTRLHVIKRLRGLLAERSLDLARAAAAGSVQFPVSEALSAQVIPLADACWFLERNASSILGPRRLGRRGRPAWLTGVSAEIHRAPHGVVLVIGASNYPLFLPGVQAIQALVAGNAVLLKPGAGGTPAARALAELLQSAGLDPALFRILPESAEAGRVMLSEDIDKVCFTGSAETGQSVLARLAARVVPATLELSGCDAVFVREDADLELVTRALCFGLCWNGSATCIAPRRVFVIRRLAEQLEAHLQRAASRLPQTYLPAPMAARLAPLLQAARHGGASFLAGGLRQDGTVLGPLILTGARPEMALLQADLFAPLLSVVVVETEAEALQANLQCPFALGASIFSRDLPAARALAAGLCAGVVTVNDLIVPTADPRVPFGGRRRSGFGVTRGAEGLLAMTAPKVLTIRRSGAPAHLKPLGPDDEEMFRHYLLMAHGSDWRTRLRAGLSLVRQLITRRRRNTSNTATHTLP